MDKSGARIIHDARAACRARADAVDCHSVLRRGVRMIRYLASARKGALSNETRKFHEIFVAGLRRPPGWYLLVGMEAVGATIGLVGAGVNAGTGPATDLRPDPLTVQLFAETPGCENAAFQTCPRTAKHPSTTPKTAMARQQFARRLSPTSSFRWRSFRKRFSQVPFGGCASAAAARNSHSKIRKTA